MRKCVECGSKKVKFVDVDDYSITVKCKSCDETFVIEPDGFDEGGMEWVEAMAKLKTGKRRKRTIKSSSL